MKRNNDGFVNQRCELSQIEEISVSSYFLYVKYRCNWFVVEHHELSGRMVSLVGFFGLVSGAPVNARKIPTTYLLRRVLSTYEIVTNDSEDNSSKMELNIIK